MPINPTDRWYRAETTPPNLLKLVERLREHYGVGPMAIGCKGDLNHVRGYHRSRAFIKNSPFCPNRSYSVSAAVNQGGDDNWLAAVDFTIPQADLLAACQRLDAATRSGRLEKVTEWYGNRDGDNKVDGYDNLANAVSTSDSSHLWHGHISIARSRANDNHDDLFDIITGGDDMTPDDLMNHRVSSPHYGFKDRLVGDIIKDIVGVSRKVDVIAAKLGIVLDEVGDLQDLVAANGDADALAQELADRLAPAQQATLWEALERIRFTVAE